MATFTTSTGKNLFNVAMGTWATLREDTTSRPGTLYFCTDSQYLYFDTLAGNQRLALNAPYAAEANLAAQANAWVSNATLEATGSGPVTLTVNDAGKTINAGTSISLTAGLKSKGVTAAYLGDGAVETAKIKDAAVTNAKLQYSYITIGGQNIALGSAISAAALTQLRSDLGLSSALRFMGTTATAITDGSTTVPTGITFGANGPQNGDVIILEDTKKEFVYVDGKWREFGDPSGYMTKLSAAYSKGASADGGSLTVVTGIKQNVNGAITAYTGTLPNASTSAKGVASFNSTHFTTSSGAVSLKLGTDASWSAPAADKLSTPLVVTISSSNGKNTVTHDENNLASGKLDLKLPATITATLSGNASTATALTSKSIGSTAVPVYFDANGKPAKVKEKGSGTALNVDIAGNAATATVATSWSTATDIKIGNAAKEIKGGESSIIEFKAEEIGSTVVWQTWS